jgi:DNA-directed RNA polymerase subunit beta
VFFETANQRTYFLGKIIPYRGSWVEFEYDTKNLLYVRIDRKRKFLGSIFLRALGLKSDQEILEKFYRGETLELRDKKLFWGLSEGLVGMKLSHHILHPKSKEELVHAGRKISPALYKDLVKAHVQEVEVSPHDLEGAWLMADVIDTSSGEVLAEANTELTAERLGAFFDAGIQQMRIMFPERDDIGTVLSQTLRKDTIKTSDEALIEIYRKLRPGDPPTLDTAKALFDGMFRDPRKYDFC